MFLSLTIATIAAMIGSTLSRLKTEADGNEEEREIASSSGKKVDGQECITLSKNEMVLYERLSNAIFYKRDVSKIEGIIIEIESEYCRIELMEGEESPSELFNTIRSRFGQYCKSEDLDIDFAIFENMKNYIEFIFLKPDRATLTERYARYPLFEPLKNSDRDKIIDPERITAKFKKIIDANDAIKKYGLSFYPYCYYDLLNDSGDVYKELEYLNEEMTFITNKKQFNNLIFNEIAETIIANTDFYFCKGLTAQVLAKDMNAHLIHYLHHNQPEIEKGQDVGYLANILFNNYFKGRKIRNYYYFLILCARFVGALKTNWQGDKIFMNIDKQDVEGFNFEAKKVLFRTIKKSNYPYLEDLTDDEIWRHVLATKAENEDKDKNWSKEILLTRQEASSCMPSA